MQDPKDRGRMNAFVNMTTDVPCPTNECKYSKNQCNYRPLVVSILSDKTWSNLDTLIGRWKAWDEATKAAKPEPEEIKSIMLEFVRAALKDLNLANRGKAVDLNALAQLSKGHAQTDAVWCWLSHYWNIKLKKTLGLPATRVNSESKSIFRRDVAGMRALITELTKSSLS